MNWTDAVETVVERTGVERYRWLCSDTNTLRSPNDRDTWRQYMIVKASQAAPDITAHLAEAAAQDPRAVRPCGSC